MKRERSRVLVIGLWHLGCIYAACLAKLGYEVVGTDENFQFVTNLTQGKPPIYEPGLEQLVRDGISSQRLRFGEWGKAIGDVDYVVLAYDTPVDSDDNVDLSVINRSIASLKRLDNATIIVSSQVPVGTCDSIASKLSIHGNVDLAYVPENLRLGKAIERFMKPEMIIIGSNTESAATKAKALFGPIGARIIEMDLRSAEMTKHALNAYLATCISYANEIGNICDLIGADGLKVMEALKADSRVGRGAPLRPGLGFSGGTLARDLKILDMVGRKNGYVPLLVESVLAVNQKQNASIVDRVRRLIGNIDGRVVTILGLTYKGGTDTLRRSIALEIMKNLQAEGAVVKCYDPRVSSTKDDVKLRLSKDAYEACEGADIAVILSDWQEFAQLDFDRVKLLMREPMILDTQNMLDPRKMTESGVKYVGVGRGIRD